MAEAPGWRVHLFRVARAAMVETLEGPIGCAANHIYLMEETLQAIREVQIILDPDNLVDVDDD